MSTQETPNLEINSAASKRLPSFLNTLTILTLIGSALGILSQVYNYFTVCDSIQKMEEMDLDALGGGAMADMMETAKQLAEKQCENNLAILLSVLISCGLCAFGAWQMRSLKRQGFAIYTLGEFLAPIASIVLLGSTATGSMMMMAGFIIPVIFVILYFTQLKHLTK
jgi:hypothetical protein